MKQFLLRIFYWEHTRLRVYCSAPRRTVFYSVLRQAQDNSERSQGAEKSAGRRFCTREDACAPHFFFNILLFLFPVLAVASDDIRDIRGPIHIPYPWLWLAYGIAIISFLASAFWFYRKWKQRRPVVIKLPHEIALERLQLALMLMKTEKVREFSIAVSDAVRFYIEDRFQLQAAHKTTEEFLHDVLSNPDSPLTAYGPSLEEFLKYCDLAKFAKWSLSISEMEGMYRSGEKLVNETK